MSNEPHQVIPTQGLTLQFHIIHARKTRRDFPEPTAAHSSVVGWRTAPVPVLFFVDGKRRIYVTGPYTVTVVHCDTRYNEANPCAYAVEDERGDPQHNIREDIFYSTKEEADAYAYEWNRRADEADGLLDED